MWILTSFAMNLSATTVCGLKVHVYFHQIDKDIYIEGIWKTKLRMLILE